MQEHEQYCTVAEAAARLQRTEAEIWRMLETGALPAMLRANQTGKDGEPLGFDFATLSPEGVRILADQEGDDFTLEWQACGGHIKATCYPARASSLRVLWEPALFPELMPSEPQAAAHEPAAAGTGKAESLGAATEPTSTGTRNHQARKQRRDLLTPAIEKAQAKAKEATDTAEVFCILRDMAKAMEAPFIGVTDSGLKWRDASDEFNELSIDALRKRINRRTAKS